MKLSPQTEEGVAECRARVCFGYPWWLRPLLLREVVAITLGRRIYLAAQVSEEQIESILRHELVHVRQAAEHGVLRFFWSYAIEYASNRRRGMSRDQAYRAISFEREAFAAEGDDSV